MALLTSCWMVSCSLLLEIFCLFVGGLDDLTLFHLSLLHVLGHDLLDFLIESCQLGLVLGALASASSFFCSSSASVVSVCSHAAIQKIRSEVS